MTKVRKTYTPEFKLEMIKLIEEQGQKIGAVANQYEIGESSRKHPTIPSFPHIRN